MFNICQNGSKHRTSMKCGPCSWQPLAPRLARSAVLRAGRVTETGLWEQEDISGTLQKISVLRHFLGSVLPGTAVSGTWLALSSWGTALLFDPVLPLAQNRCYHGVLSQGDLVFSSPGILVRGG